MTNLHTDIDSQQTVSPQETQAREWAQARLSAHRFLHTEGVVETVTRLCTHHQIAALPALRVAGWIHDAAKELPPDELLTQAERLGCEIRPVERACPDLLHGEVALALARRELGIDDPAILSAVRYHTTGAPGMSQADRVFYLADLIEPSRSYAWIMQAREMAYQDIDVALLFALTYQFRRLLKQGAIIDPRGIELRNELLLTNVAFVPRLQE